MRRTLLFLAVLAAGSWGGRAPAAPAPGDAAATQELVDAPGIGSQAFLRAGSALPLLAWQDVNGNRGPSPSGREAGSGADDALARAARETMAARAHDQLDGTAGLALLRAGRSSFYTATPPPFRSV